jgi:putative methionine-R-sulfoxide reductase with GAF domain
MARPYDFFERALVALDGAIDAARREGNPEDAVRHFTRTTREVLGDPDVQSRLGSLKTGETQFVVSGVFFIAPSRDHMVLFADHGFPPSQRHAHIGVSDSRPGHAVQTKTAAVVPNTDEDRIFRQILSTGRVGCSIYVPVFWGRDVIGLFNTAAQARYTYDESDLLVQKLFANAAGAAWMALGGPELLEKVTATLGPWS